MINITYTYQDLLLIFLGRLPLAEHSQSIIIIIMLMLVGSIAAIKSYEPAMINF